MSFDLDPGEQANISGADFAIMCDELAALRAENASLKEVISLSEDSRLMDECRKQLQELLGEYWDCAYNEGHLRRPDGNTANRILHRILELWNRRAMLEAAPQQDVSQEDKSCNPHPDAPHGFDRNASHNAGRYVCECEGWQPVAVQEVKLN